MEVFLAVIIDKCKEVGLYLLNLDFSMFFVRSESKSLNKNIKFQRLIIKR